MLEIKHLDAGYPNLKVIQDFSYSFSGSKLYVLIGRNGSGKSTLLNTIGGWLNPQQGQVLIHGQDLFSLRDVQKAKLTGRVMTEFDSISMSVERFVLLGAYSRQSWFSFNEEKEKKRAKQILKTLHIETLALKRMDQISSGQRQKAAIAQVLLQNPACLFLDEPGSYLDIASRFELMESLCKLRSPERILLVVVHDLDLALRYGDEILVLDEGKLVFAGSANELVQSSVLEDVFKICLLDWDEKTHTGRILPVSIEK